MIFSQKIAFKINEIKKINRKEKKAIHFPIFFFFIKKLKKKLKQN